MEGNVHTSIDEWPRSVLDLWLSWIQLPLSKPYEHEVDHEILRLSIIAFDLQHIKLTELTGLFLLPMTTLSWQQEAAYLKLSDLLLVSKPLVFCQHFRLISLYLALCLVWGAVYFLNDQQWWFWYSVVVPRRRYGCQAVEESVAPLLTTSLCNGLFSTFTLATVRL